MMIVDNGFGRSVLAAPDVVEDERELFWTVVMMIFLPLSITAAQVAYRVHRACPTVAPICRRHCPN